MKKYSLSFIPLFSTMLTNTTIQQNPVILPIRTLGVNTHIAFTDLCIFTKEKNKQCLIDTMKAEHRYKVYQTIGENHDLFKLERRIHKTLT